MNNIFRYILKKIYVLIVISVLILCIYKLINYQIVNNKANKEKIIQQKTLTIMEEPQRGNIITKDGQLIVREEQFYNINIEPTKIPKDAILPILNIIDKYSKLNIDKKYREILEAKEKGIKKYTVVEYITTTDKLTIDDEIAKNRKYLYVNAKSKDKSIYSAKYYYPEKVNKRTYEDYNIYQNIIGYISQHGSNYGIESSYNDILEGTPGIYQKLRPNRVTDGDYQIISEQYEKEIQQKKNGMNIRLSIDSIIQNDLDRILKKSYEETEAVGAMGIVFDIEEGKIMAMSQYPNAQNRGNIKNINITNIFEPGSIFKPIIVSMGINEKKIDENTIINSKGYIRVKDKIIRDHDESTKGDLTITEIIAHSGNVAMVKIAEMIPNKIFYNYLENFGFSSKTGIDIDYELKNRIIPLDKLSEVRKSNISFGQGIATTQIQMLMALISTINGGMLIKPTIVDSFYDDNGNITKKEKEIIRQVIDKKTSDKIREMLSQVVMTGTGRGARIKGYTIGGKTGTAQKAGKNGYEAGKYYSSFFSFFPINKPKYAILITIDEPRGKKYYGASVALPPAKEIIEKILTYKDIAPDKPNELIADEFLKTIEQEKAYQRQQSKKRKITDKVLKEITDKFHKDIMPNLLGLNKKELLKVIPKYNIEIRGHGIVISQSVLENEPINKEMKIVIEME